MVANAQPESTNHEQQPATSVVETSDTRNTHSHTVAEPVIHSAADDAEFSIAITAFITSATGLALVLLRRRAKAAAARLARRQGGIQ